MFGKSSSTNFNLKSELGQFDDIILGDFEDSYENLPMKTLMIHKFIAQFCKEARWIFIHDDDAYVCCNL